MSAFDSIVNRKPRENAGSLAANRFSYQLDWGLRKLLALEESGHPYTIIFDYHDDILVLDSDESPEGIEFYQVKTNMASGGWRKSDLTRINKKETSKEAVQLDVFEENNEDDDSKYSKIAKLLIHSLDFKEARDFFFVTNANFGSTLVEGEFNRVKELNFTQLKKEAREHIKDKIKAEIPDIDDKVFEHLHFIKNQMNVDDHRATVIGYLSEFLEMHYPKAKAIAKPVYETLMGEITKRNNHETIPNSVEDLLNNKAFTKSQFHQFLKGLETYETYELKKTIIQSFLAQYISDGAAAKRRSILRQMDKIKEDTLVYDNHEFLRLFSTIETLIDETADDVSNEWEWSQKVLERLKKEYSFTTIHHDDYLTCLILYELIP